MMIEEGFYRYSYYELDITKSGATYIRVWRDNDADWIHLYDNYGGLPEYYLEAMERTGPYNEMCHVCNLPIYLRTGRCEAVIGHGIL